jgi:hypothetical protein
MIAELLGLVDALSKVKDVKDLLVQERLKAMITFLEKVGEVQIRTAIEELQALPHSTRPDEERARAIGHLKVAASALVMSLEKRPFLRRLSGFDKKRKMRAYLQITGCYLVVTGLYRSQQNNVLATQYALRASESFEDYAAIRRFILSRALGMEFTYNGGTDQAPLVLVADNKKLRGLMKHYNVPGAPHEGTFSVLADRIVNEERHQLFGWLEPLRKLP